MLRAGFFAAAWLFIAWYVARAVAVGSLAPATRTTIAFVLISFLGFTSLILAEALIEKRAARAPSSGDRLWPWGAGGAVFGGLVMLLTTHSHHDTTSQIPGIQTVLFGTLVGLWAGLALGLGLKRRPER
jgi:hypothetical protein